jgi:hypothetical protein
MLAVGVRRDKASPTKLDYLDDDLRARYPASGFVGLPIL